MADCMLIRTWATMDPYEVVAIDSCTLLAGIREAAAELDRLREAELSALERMDQILNRTCELREQLDRLQAIVDRLPKTVDGVPVVRGDELWHGGKEYVAEQVAYRRTNTRISMNPTFCFSSREAENAAKTAKLNSQWIKEGSTAGHVRKEVPDKTVRNSV